MHHSTDRRFLAQRVESRVRWMKAKLEEIDLELPRNGDRKMVSVPFEIYVITFPLLHFLLFPLPIFSNEDNGVW